MSHAKVSVIVLNWNGLEDTAECLESLKKSAYPDYEVIVVDNASKGDDIKVLKERFGDYIQVVQNDSNLGCGEGFNSGIRYVMEHSRPEYIMVMNNDLVVAPECIGELVKALENDESAGIAGAKIYFYDYNGRSDIIWSAGGRISRWGLKIHSQIGEYDNDLPKYQVQSVVDWISACVMLFRRSLIERIGLFNPWYFIGHEDIEFCLDARKHGVKSVYIPTAKAWHKVGVARDKSGIRFDKPAIYYYLIKRCFPRHVYLYHLLITPFLRFPRWLILFLTGDHDIHYFTNFFEYLTAPILRRRRSDTLDARREQHRG